MSSETGSRETQIPVSVFRRLLSLIPPRSLGSTLCELAALWCEATDSSAAYIGIFNPRTASLTAALCRAPRLEVESVVREAVPFASKLPLKDQLADLFQQGCPFTEISSEPACSYVRSCHDQSVVGLFLFSSLDNSENEPLVLELLDTSQRLLHQALVQESVSSAGATDLSGREINAAESGEMDRWVIPSRDKLEAMAEFAAGAGHEINNPVATIVGRVQMLLKSETDPQRRQALSTIGGQAYRVRDMIGDAMLFARPPAPHPESLPLRNVVDEVLHSLQEEISRSNSHLELNVPETLSIWADETQCKVVLSNLILNSLHAIEAGGQIQISAGERTIEARRCIHIRVIDDGAGFSDQERIHLFDPFYSARQAGRGLGFGLSKCWRIITMHGGTIAAERNPERGVTFHVDWPAECPASSTDSPV